VIINLDKAAKTRNSLVGHNLGSEGGESVVQSRYKIELSRNSFFEYRVFGFSVVLRKMESDGNDPEGVIEIRKAMAECHQTTRGEERVLQ
jgi:hypothetical protein